MMIKFGLALCMIAAGIGCAQSGQGSAQAAAPQAQDAAQGGLATLRQLVTDQNFREMGFDSRDDVGRAAVAPPWTMFNIGLDQLKRYQRGADVNALLTASAETIFPVTVNGQVKSSITVTKADAGFKPSSFGNAALVKAIAPHTQAAGSFIVRVPAFNMYYVGTRVDGRLMLTAIIDDTRMKTQVGVAVPAEQVLEELARIAGNYNGEPI
jgi:hypothetical protein